MKKRNPWLIMLVFVVALAVLACTCTSSIPGVGGNDSNSGNSGNSGDSGNSGNSGNSGDSGDSSGSAKEVRGFPVVSDAYEIVDTEFAGTISIIYNTKMSFNDVVSFYKDEMSAYGYTLDQDVSAAGSAVLTYNGEKMLTVSVSASPTDSGAQVVTVSALPK